MLPPLHFQPGCNSLPAAVAACRYSEWGATRPSRGAFRFAGGRAERDEFREKHIITCRPPLPAVLASNSSSPVFSPPLPGSDPSVAALGLPPDYGESKEAARSAHASLAVEAAPSLCEPESFFDPDLEAVLEALASMSDSDVSSRQLSELAAFRDASSRLWPATEQAIRRAPPSVASVLRAASPSGMHVSLLEWAFRRADWPDAAGLSADLLRGFPLVGPLPADLTAPAELRPARLSPAAVLQDAPGRFARVVSKTRATLSRMSPEQSEQLQAVFTKTGPDGLAGAAVLG